MSAYCIACEATYPAAKPGNLCPTHRTALTGIVRDVLTAAPLTIEQIVDLVNDGIPPYAAITPRLAIVSDLAILVAEGFAVRVSLPVGDGWRLAGTT